MDARLKKTLNAGGRESRSSQDLSRAAPEEAFISKQERRKMWSDEWTQSALPKVPDIPGWHLCWLSTTNGYDSIDKRMRLGYVPVRADELPGFDNYRVKAGEDIGFIACNEMRLYKLPMEVCSMIVQRYLPLMLVWPGRYLYLETGKVNPASQSIALYRLPVLAHH